MELVVRHGLATELRGRADGSDGLVSAICDFIDASRLARQRGQARGRR